MESRLEKALAASLILFAALLLYGRDYLVWFASPHAELLRGQANQIVLDETPLSLDARTKTADCAIDGPYPDHACTPGAVFASTTKEIVCTPGYSKSVRAVTVSTKRAVYAEYGISYPQPTGSYEADHFIPLELGGSNDIANLFPEAAAPKPGFREKDIVENYLHEAVCAGLMSLPEAAREISSDWLAVYNSLSADEIARLRAEFSGN